MQEKYMENQDNKPTSGGPAKSEMEHVKAIHRKSGVKLAEYLRRQGKLGERELMDYVSAQLKIDRYTPGKYPLDQNLREILPEKVFKERQLVPLRKKDNMLWVATADPINLSMLDAVEKLTKMELEPVYCPIDELNDLIYQFYGSKADMGEMLGTLEELSVESESDKDEVQDISVASLQDAPVIKLVNQILVQAVSAGASDVHISPKRDSVQLRFRIDGQLHEIPAPPKSVFMSVISRLKLLSNMDISVTRIPQDGRFSFHVQTKEVNVRASALPTIYGENLVMRLLMKKTGTLTLKDLGMIDEDREKCETAINKSYGMVLATGPTGSGKTTLLYALLREVDKPNINIITLEDPVESRIDSIRQVQLNRKAGMTFASGLRSILRQDPDVLMVGEIRDGETAHIAVESAMTGHRLLSTVHTNDAPGAISRFNDMGIEPFLVASTLLLAVGQRLVRRICPNCREAYAPPAKMVEGLKLAPGSTINFIRGRGCPSCNNTGYKGRVGVYEALVIDEAIQNMIMKQLSSKEISRAAVQAKTFRTMKFDALSKVAQGVTTLEEAAPIIFM
jgi:type IV pilus assembly protein PilB